MKKSLILLFLIVGAGLAPALSANEFNPNQFHSGAGTSENPYIITSDIHLWNLSIGILQNNISKDRFFKLGNNINFFSEWENFMPIGFSDSPFQGNFDGNGFSINGLRIIQNDNRATGLFGYTSGATIKNLNIRNGKIYNGSGTYGGSLIGYATNTIVDNCSVTGIELTVFGESTGGLIGFCEDITITRSSFEGNVTGNNNVGGFIGTIGIGDNIFSSEKNIVKDCYSSTKTTGIRNVGGFIGRIYLNSASAEINGCYSTGSVYGTSVNIGGFIGDCYGGTNIISNCYSTSSTSGSIASSDNVGGFIGYASHVTITRCFATGMVVGKSGVGGFVGYLNSEIFYCYAVGAVEGNYEVGGFIGIGGFSIVIYDCFAAGAVVAEIFSGGFAGMLFEKINNCYFDKQTSSLVIGIGEDFSANSEITAASTSELIQNQLPSGFFTNIWVPNQGYYPQLRVFVENTDPIKKTMSALSVVPFKLANDTELSSEVLTFVRQTDTTPTGSPIVWTANPSEKATVINNLVYAEESNEWRTLTLRVDDMERFVKFRSTKGFTIPEILNLKINEITFDNIDGDFVYHIECGSTDEWLFAEITLPPYTTSLPGSPLRLFANQPQTIEVSTNNGQTKTYNFTIVKHLSSDIFIQRWDDVLAINNNFTTNGGYMFTNYEWYKGIEEIPNSRGKGYIKEPGGFEKNVKYTVVLTYLDNEEIKSITTCPANIDYDVLEKNIAVWPNPVQREQTINIDFGSAKPTILKLFNSKGTLVTTRYVSSAVTELTAPSVPGQYILQSIENGLSVKIIVE